MTTDPPIWLLDVDGVINAEGPYAHGVKKSARWLNPYWGGCKMDKGRAICAGGYWTIRWAPPLIDRINELHDSGLVQIRPCTTWNSDWADLARLVGLPQDLSPAFPTVGLHPREVAARKRQAAAGVLAAGGALIWTDDVETPFHWELAHAEMCAGGRALLIRPQGDLGLLPGDLDQIELFAQRHAHYPVDPQVEAVMP